MSIGIFALKIGLVTAAAGTAIVTPILLGKRGNPSSALDVLRGTGSTSNSYSPEIKTIDEQQDALSEGGSRIESHVEVPKNSANRGGDSDTSESHNLGVLPKAQEEVQIASKNTVSNERVNSVSAEIPSTITESFNKKCFVVPAKSGGDKNIQLLTCFDSRNYGHSNKEGGEPEYDSEFYVLDPSRNNGIPLKVEGKISWEPSKNHVSIQMSQNASATNEYTFVSEGSGWSSVSKKSVIMPLEQCATYEITSQTSSHKGTFWLSCGDNTSEDFDSESPTAIPLASWQKTK